jgi:hypothetical protein
MLELDQNFYKNLFTQEIYQRKLNRYRLHNSSDIEKSFLAYGILQKDIANGQDTYQKLPVYDLARVAHVRRTGLYLKDYRSFSRPDDPSISQNLPSFPRLIPHFQESGRSDGGYPKLFTNVGVRTFFEQRTPKIIQLMKEFPGKLFIAGGCFYSIYREGSIENSDIDVFICASSPREAENILRRGVEIIESTSLGMSDFYNTEVSPMVVTAIYCIDDIRYIKVQFIRRLYPEGRPDMIVGAFDIHPCQIFWSLETGIQCTTGALVSLLTQTFPLDLSRRSFSFSRRLEKYIIEKRCDLILPGVDLRKPAEMFGKITGPNGQKEIFDYFANNITALPNQYKFSSHGGNSSDYTEDDKDESFMEAANGLSRRNLKVLLRQGTNVMMKIESYSLFCTEKIDFLYAVLGNECSFEFIKGRTASQIKSMFKTVEAYREFAMAHFVDMDLEKSRIIWEENLQNIVEYLKPLFGKDSDPIQYWKVENPGSQGFGQNFPRPIEPKIYYGAEHYFPIRAGLSDLSYWTICQITRQNRLPPDIFRMLCLYTFKAEAEHAYEKLNLL